MSWSTYGIIKHTNDVYQIPKWPGDLGEFESPSVEAFEAAKRAVEELIRSRALGEGPFRVNLSGHANPGHKPIEGWANDQITIIIGQEAK